MNCLKIRWPKISNTKLTIITVGLVALGCVFLVTLTNPDFREKAIESIYVIYKKKKRGRIKVLCNYHAIVRTDPKRMAVVDEDRCEECLKQLKTIKSKAH